MSAQIVSIAGHRFAGYARRYTAEFPEFAVTQSLVLWFKS